MDKGVGVLGARSMVGLSLLPMLAEAGWRVIAFSRRAAVPPEAKGAVWRQPSLPPVPAGASLEDGLSHWICVAPIWVLPDYFELLKAHGARRIVALSSTSRFTKHDSSDLGEQAVSRRLAEAEERLRSWAEREGMEWVILRPTLIYGRGRDKNISEIARFIRRFGFFPLLGHAQGLRQPVHAQDVAAACLAALDSGRAANRDYNLSGGEILAYRDMVGRVFLAMGRRPRLLTVPLGVFRLAVACLRWLPRFRGWSPAMAERMNRDLVFDHGDAARELGFRPRQFVLSAEDVPR